MTTDNVTVRNFTLNKRNKTYIVKLSDNTSVSFSYANNYLAALYEAFSYIEINGYKCDLDTASNPLTLALVIAQNAVDYHQSYYCGGKAVSDTQSEHFDILSKYFNTFINILEQMSSYFKKGDRYYSDKHYASFKDSVILSVRGNFRVYFNTDDNGNLDYEKGTINGRFVRKFNILQLAVLASKSTGIKMLTPSDNRLVGHKLNINDVNSFVKLS